MELELLSQQAQDQLLKWEQHNCYTIDDYLAAPTIGQLIHFLSERIPLTTHFEILREKAFGGDWSINSEEAHGLFGTQLIDVLWEETKLILEG